MVEIEDFEYELDSFRRTMKNLGGGQKYAKALERLSRLALKDPGQAKRALRQLRQRMVSGFWDSSRGDGSETNVLPNSKTVLKYGKAFSSKLSSSQIQEVNRLERYIKIYEGKNFDKNYSQTNDLARQAEKVMGFLTNISNKPTLNSLNGVLNRNNSIDQQVYMDQRKWAWKEGKKDGPASDRSVDKLFTQFGSFFK